MGAATWGRSASESRSGRRFLRNGPAMALYAVLDHCVDGYEVAARGVDVDIQQVELEVFSDDVNNPTERIYKLEREVLDFARAVAAALGRRRRDRPRAVRDDLGGPRRVLP